jgi:hypothetical protein
MEDRSEVVELLSPKVRMWMRGQYGSSLTPLHYAAARVYREIVELLVADDAGDSYYIFTANPQSLRAPQSMSTFAHG